MYGVRAVCRNPACQEVFVVEVAGLGPLEAETPEIALELSKDLRGKHPITYKTAKLDNKVEIPEFIECPKCNSILPRSDLTFFAYNASRNPT